MPGGLTVGGGQPQVALMQPVHGRVRILDTAVVHDDIVGQAQLRGTVELTGEYRVHLGFRNPVTPRGSFELHAFRYVHDEDSVRPRVALAHQRIDENRVG